MALDIYENNQPKTSSSGLILKGKLESLGKYILEKERNWQNYKTLNGILKEEDFIKLGLELEELIKQYPSNKWNLMKTWLEKLKYQKDGFSNYIDQMPIDILVESVP